MTGHASGGHGLALLHGGFDGSEDTTAGVRAVRRGCCR
ncbi:hypothetical protein [Streptomyces sp. enrichment culture]